MAVRRGRRIVTFWDDVGDVAAHLDIRPGSPISLRPRDGSIRFVTADGETVEMKMAAVELLADQLRREASTR